MDAPSFNDLQLNEENTLQAQLHRYLLEKINNGQLPPGTRLPSSRKIAQDANISRNTVTSVLEQLKAEGFLESRPGNGIFVNLALPSAGNLTSIQWAKHGHLPDLSNFGKLLSNEIEDNNRHSLPFTPGIPDLDAFPDKIWQRIQRVHQDRSTLKGYQGSQGYAPLRQALAEYLTLSRGVRCEPEQIIITHGAQQAITLCALALLNEGDPVLIENPGYINASRAFLAVKAQLIAVPVDHQGLNVDKLPNKTNAKLIYTTPTHQYPLGAILPAAQRLKLLDWAATRNLWIIEDDYDSEFHFHGKTIASLQGMAEQTPVLYIGSFSKTLFPALRIGYLIVPKPLVATFVKAKAYTSGESALLPQAIAADFISEGHFVRHLRKMRQLYEKKWDHLKYLVDLHLKDLATPIAESAGMHLALQIDTRDDVELKNKFQDQGYGSTPLSDYFIDSITLTGLVLGFANTTAVDREKGIKALKKIIKDQRK